MLFVRKSKSCFLGIKGWSKSANYFIEYLEDVWKIIRDNLLTSPEEEYRRVLYVGDVLTRSRKSHDMIVLKERQLKERLYEKKNEVHLLLILQTLLSPGQTIKHCLSNIRDFALPAIFDRLPRHKTLLDKQNSFSNVFEKLKKHSMLASSKKCLTSNALLCGHMILIPKMVYCDFSAIWGL